ncbi:hypothetical protein K504DRAFT_369809 [Pleomassaria siparia CBS 279.74]|uniref:Mitochondrial carrier n=1 Tax=Pleomassaria siparia CBS 279.74 TaxID=1314801 RepID=A0A6G1KLR5_9PLEO|nr:hypothetical protein K504DRAFT_369809 [Pleomassaria siparia CBS 279.74]
MPLRLPTAALFIRPRANTFISTTPLSARRTFTTTPHMLLKEDENRSRQEIEDKKQEHLKKQKRGEGEWDEKLGSQSEGNVAADKEDVKDHDDHMDKLQKETSNKANKGEL